MHKKHLSAATKMQLIEEARKLCASYGTSIGVLATWDAKLKTGRSFVRANPARDRYLRYMSDNPHHTALQAARALGVSRQRIYQLRKETCKNG